jgi:hypothetical protein
VIEAIAYASAAEEIAEAAIDSAAAGRVISIEVARTTMGVTKVVVP